MTNLLIQLLRLTPDALVVSLIPTAVYTLSYTAAKKSLPPIRRIVLVAAFSAYAFIVLSVTLFNRPAIFCTNNIELFPFASYRRAMRAPTHLAILEIRDIILNIAMFIPLGIFLPIFYSAFRKFRITIPIAFLTSLAIEIAQIATCRGIFSTEDIIHNTLGAVLGLALFLLPSKIVKS